MSRKLEEIQQFLVNDETSIHLLLYCIGNQISYKRYLKLHESTPDDLQLLDMSGIIDYDYDLRDYVLSKDALDYPSHIRTHLHEYRAVFSKNEDGKEGIRPGALGDPKSIVRKLTKWFKENDYTMPEVIATARYYVDGLRKKGDLKFLMNADYFILKNDRSQLSALIEEGKSYSRTGQTINVSDELI